MVKVSKTANGKSTGESGDVRAERLTMRVHPDLMRILDMRAKERNLSRSAYIESILIGWCRADPRNPKLDPRGKFVEGAPSPLEQMNSNSFAWGQRFMRFSQAYHILMGTEAPQAWQTEPQEYWMGDNE